jgi:hypothetical protein
LRRLPACDGTSFCASKIARQNKLTGWKPFPRIIERFAV